MPKAYSQEFWEDVVCIARQGELTFDQIARDFGISKTCAPNWVLKADIENGRAPGTTAAEAAESRRARRRIQILDEDKNTLRRADLCLGQANLTR